MFLHTNVTNKWKLIRYFIAKFVNHKEYMHIPATIVLRFDAIQCFTFAIRLFSIRFIGQMKSNNRERF